LDDIVFAPSAKSADAPDIEAGLYDARFDGVTKKFIEGGMYGDGDRYEWAFTLLDDDGAVMYDGGEPVEVTGLSSMSLNTKSKTTPRALKYLKAIMSPDEFAILIEDGTVKASDLAGRVVQVMVDIRDSGWPTIKDVLPPRKRRAARAARPTEADAD
jgi:hypothetical protein